MGRVHATALRHARAPAAFALVCLAAIPDCRDRGASPPYDAAAQVSVVDTGETLARRARLVAAIDPQLRMSARVRQAMLEVPRHAFVPAHLQREAYADYPLPIGQGQTISQPTVVAMMTQAVQPQANEVVLEVGTGSGYQAAVLAKLCSRVETIEIVPALAAQARKTIDRLGYSNVHVHVGDGYLGLPQQGPYDAIVITAAPPEIPSKLVEQLRDGGRMVVPVGPQHGGQDLLLLRKQGAGLARTNLGPVRFVPMVPGK